VIGASSFTLRVSGITTFRSTSFKLPIRNLPVISPYIKRGNGSSDYILKQVTDALKRTDIIQGETPIVLAFSNPVGMQYRELKSFTEGLASALKPQTQVNAPIILVFEKDIGNSVGNVLKRETGMGNVLSIDEVSLKEGDFIDIGEPITENSIYPVVVKSLVFED
jgi:ethanolamine utilization protein EutA